VATVLNFIAMNCGFCRKQVPVVERVRAEYERAGVRFINVVQRMRKDYTTDEAVEILAGLGSNLECATDFGNSVGPKFDASTFPTMVIIDRAGIVRHVNIGARKNLGQALREQIGAMIEVDGSTEREPLADLPEADDREDAAAETGHEAEPEDGRVEATPAEVFAALRCGDVQTLREYIEVKPEDVDIRDGSDQTLLHVSLIGRCVRCVEFLLAHGADPNARLGTAFPTALAVARFDLGVAKRRGWTDEVEVLEEIEALLLRHGAREE
jgi:hypothetical protein